MTFCCLAQFFPHMLSVIYSSCYKNIVQEEQINGRARAEANCWVQRGRPPPLSLGYSWVSSNRGLFPERFSVPVTRLIWLTLEPSCQAG